MRGLSDFTGVTPGTTIMASLYSNRLEEPAFEDVPECAPEHAPDKDGDSSSKDIKPEVSKEIDFLQDKLGHMTFGRRIALYLSRRYSWYNPYLGKDEGAPSIEKSWAYFDHVTLERYALDENYQPTPHDINAKERVIKAFYQGDRRLRIASPGERNFPTKLYNPITTPLSQMGDFGLGFGIYFSTLRAFAVLSLFAGILNLPNLLYFAGDDYSGGQPGVSTLLQGSAICTDRMWVPCPTCERQDFQSVGYPTKRDLFTHRFTSNTTHGNSLNITNYLDWGGDPEKWHSEAFNEDTMARLYQDYGIRFHLFRIELDGYADMDCFKSTCEEHFYGEWNEQTEIPNIFLYVGQDVTYADTRKEDFGFVEKNLCDGATLQQGYINLATVLLFVIGARVIRWRQDGLEVVFDEDEQTCSDYSIVVLNPPSDACDPEEWKHFFEGQSGGKVAVCTVNVNNDEIVQQCVERKLIYQRLQSLLPGNPLDDDNLAKEVRKVADETSSWTKFCRMVGIGHKTAPEYYEDYKGTTESLIALLADGQSLPVTSVFVTFETEAAQRQALSTLTVGKIQARRNDTSSVKGPDHLFRGKHVLEVKESDEPSTIRWTAMNVTRMDVARSLVWTTFLTLAAISMCFLLIMPFYTELPFVASTLTTVFTSAFPLVAKKLMNKERHRSECSRQKWLFIKIAFFNIAITSILVSVVTPFTASLDNQEESLKGLIPAVHGLFFTQLGLTPFLQMADIAGNIQRHILAPRAKTQADMDMHFRGAQVYLAERYANLMKYLFLMVWYCALYPAGFFMGCFALTIVYFADRFSLMRTWVRMPQLGTDISDFGRNYCVPAAIALMAVLSAYAWSGFPYDNLCVDEDTGLDEIYIGNWSYEEEGPSVKFLRWNLFKMPDLHANFNITGDATVYKHCLQDLRAYTEQSFPPLPRFQVDEWMTNDQERLLDVYGWVSVAILAYVLLMIVVRIGWQIRCLFQGHYAPRGTVMGIKYSDVPSIDSYLPQIQQQSGYPLILCDVDDIDPHLFNWVDPDHSHSYYDITKEAKKLVEEEDIDVSHKFASVQYWHCGPEEEAE